MPISLNTNQLTAYDDNGTAHSLPYFSNSTSNQVTQNTTDIASLSSEIETLQSIPKLRSATLSSVAYGGGNDRMITLPTSASYIVSIMNMSSGGSVAKILGFTKLTDTTVMISMAEAIYGSPTFAVLYIAKN